MPAGKKRGVQAPHLLPQADPQVVMQEKEQGEVEEKDAGDKEIDGQLGEATDSDLEEEEEEEDHHFNIPIGLGGIGKAGLTVEDLDSHATQQAPTPISAGGWRSNGSHDINHQDNVKERVGKPKRPSARSKREKTTGADEGDTTSVTQVSGIPQLPQEEAENDENHAGNKKNQRILPKTTRSGWRNWLHTKESRPKTQKEQR